MRLRKLIPTEAKLRIYKTAILPHLTYCILVWHFCKASDRKKLERVNERGTLLAKNFGRLIFGHFSPHFGQKLRTLR